MYSVHHEGVDGPVGSVRYLYITLNSPEVRSNGAEIKKTFKILPRFPHQELVLCTVEESQHSTVIKRSIGLCFSEWVTYRQPAAGIDGESLPVRLIDIEATLHSSSDGGVSFIHPTDWSFHIISHTWSQAVRDFSTSIGNTVTSAEDYNKAFRGANLNELPGEGGACYRSLLAFLSLLKEEGVKAIWFDALCINQMDKQEKDREISRMGAYYGCSLGCYVLTHGIGRGFKLWDVECCGNPHEACWFKRVWTLQEFLLPRKVTFIVEGLANKTIGYVNHFIRQAGVPGFCECALPERDHTFRTHLKKSPGGEEEEIICSSDQLGKQTRPCVRCRCVQFIRKSHEQPGLYFVEREAYCFLLQLDRGPCEDVHTLEQDHSKVLWNLFALANHHCPGQTFKLVEMLRARQCTNEEDRVLGMLGLLQRGKPGQLQLRSGKTLADQILNLHHYCDLRTFFRLCLMEPMAFQTVGMSWAPCLVLANAYNPVELGEWPKSACFHPTTRILNVSRRGLRLEARVAYARLVPRGQSMRCIRTQGERSGIHFRSSAHAKSEVFAFSTCRDLHSTAKMDDLSICFSCIVHGNNDDCTHWIRDCKLEVGDSCTFPLKAHTREGCGVKRLNCNIDRHMVIQDPWVGTSHERSCYAQFVMSFVGSSIHTLKPFPVWLVLLGEAHEDMMGYMMGMVCIAKTDSGTELHKIGTFACAKPQVPYDPLFFRNVPYGQWLIGGYGGNVGSYVSHESFS